MASNTHFVTYSSSFAEKLNQYHHAQFINMKYESCFADTIRKIRFVQYAIGERFWVKTCFFCLSFVREHRNNVLSLQMTLKNLNDT